MERTLLGAQAPWNSVGDRCDLRVVEGSSVRCV